ncbi:MAG TPA: hypothetical protein PKA33_19235 [Amaricoccus sp.]|uniref:hypothetical protein n=1 Tax=Amaricoccus sp. TaxID=1872485 RepID=UPI002C65692F|nr:hypothetical protein [Amaricoccus sp.]HMR34432.1 hypothetical protein [Geminicoccus sp.]HMU01474.1 hypothetical protein [Amaricoccus sp.]
MADDDGGDAEQGDQRYRRLWGTPVAQDCIDLKASLAGWLGERLVYLSWQVRHHAADESENSFRRDMQRHGQTLLEYGRNREDRDDAAAQTAMEWVARNFRHLWH